jgi:cytidyltransferase-like protein
VGHVDILREAKALGDYLIVGLLDDETVNRYLGGNLPIMNLHERALSVLSCRVSPLLSSPLLSSPLSSPLIQPLHSVC